MCSFSKVHFTRRHRDTETHRYRHRHTHTRTHAHTHTHTLSLSPFLSSFVHDKVSKIAPHLDNLWAALQTAITWHQRLPTMSRDQLTLGRLDPAVFVASPHNFDRGLFEVCRKVPCIRVSASLVQTLMRVCSAVLLNLPRFASVQRIPASSPQALPQPASAQGATSALDSASSTGSSMKGGDKNNSDTSQEADAKSTQNSKKPAEQRFLLFSPSKSIEEIKAALTSAFPESAVPPVRHRVSWYCHWFSGELAVCYGWYIIFSSTLTHYPKLRLRLRWLG